MPAATLAGTHTDLDGLALVIPPDLAARAFYERLGWQAAGIWSAGVGSTSSGSGSLCRRPVRLGQPVPSLSRTGIVTWLMCSGVGRRCPSRVSSWIVQGVESSTSSPSPDGSSPQGDQDGDNDESDHEAERDERQGDHLTSIAGVGDGSPYRCG